MTQTRFRSRLRLPEPDDLIGKRVVVGPKTTLRDVIRQARTPRPHTRRIAPGLYTALSHTHRGRHHHIGVDSHGRVTCSCEAFVLGEGKTCWAMKAVARRLLRRRLEREEVAAR